MESSQAVSFTPEELYYLRAKILPICSFLRLLQPTGGDPLEHDGNWFSCMHICISTEHLCMKAREGVEHRRFLWLTNANTSPTEPSSIQHAACYAGNIMAILYLTLGVKDGLSHASGRDTCKSFSGECVWHTPARLAWRTRKCMQTAINTSFN